MYGWASSFKVFGSSIREPMNMEPAILMIIITERVLEPTLKELVKRGGAKDYTIEDVASGW